MPFLNYTDLTITVIKIWQVFRGTGVLLPTIVYNVHLSNYILNRIHHTTSKILKNIFIFFFAEKCAFYERIA